MTEKMKPSGIAWIGEIPTGWDVKRVKYVIQNNADGIKVGPFGSALTNEVVSSEEGQYKIYGQANLIRKDFNYGDNFVTEENYRRLINYEVLPDDIAVSMMGTIGKCSVVPYGIQPGIMDSHLIKIRLSKKMSPRFFEYIYESCVVYEQLVVNSKGSIMNGLNSTIVKSVFLAVPSIDEQTVIADFLDAQCAKIDSVIADIEKQIETLQKYKKSLIIETITNRKANWKYGRIKDLMTLQRGHDLPQEEFVSGNVPVYGSNGVIGYHNIPTTAGPCVTIGRSGSVGALNYVNCDFWAHNTAIFIANSKGNHIRYLYYVLQSFDIKELANGSAVPTLDRKKVEGIHLYFTLDPIEQREIANYLDARITKFNQIIDVKQLQLDTIRQHKKSLIYEYVTGKKRVTEVN